MKKTNLRKLYLQKRMALSPQGYLDFNQQLLQQFKTLNLSGIKLIHCFLPMKEQLEPDTNLIINYLKKNHPDIRLAYPKADFNTCTMQHILDDDALQLANNEYGIPEPVAGNEVDVALIDMVILPLLSFDEQGYRVGYGKGFYDRFMADCKPGTRFIGLSFFEPVDAIEDANSFDIPLHACITPFKVWEWGSEIPR